MSKMSNITQTPCDKGVLNATPHTASGRPPSEMWVLVATILGSSMAFIDGSVVNVALPVLQVDLNATAADVQWVVEAYLLLLASLVLLGGTLGDHFGRRRIFAAGIALFSLASVWCGLSPNIGSLILARAVQGIGAALLVPGSLAIISASFNASQRGRAIGTWSGFTSITSAIGPVLGGGLVQYASWRWVFFLNVPLAVIVLVILFLYVPESRDEATRGGLDWRGALLATIGLGAIVYALIEAGSLGILHPLVLSILAVGIIIFVAFLLLEARISNPMIPLTLFRSSSFSGANLLTLLLYAAMNGITFYLPFNLIQVQGYPPTLAGLALLPFVLLMFSLSRWAGGLVDRYGARLPLVVGPVIAAIGFALFAVPSIGGTYWLTFLPAVLVMGLGMTITVAPLTTVVMGSVEERHAGIASGINNAVARTAGLLAIAVLGIVVVASFQNNLVHQLAQLPLPASVQQTIAAQGHRLAAIQLPGGISGEARTQIKQAIDEAFVASFRLAALICSALGLLGACCSWFMIQDTRNTRKGATSEAKQEQQTSHEEAVDK
jgi:EmrB/QacA subfamily drug resistance transporter